MHAHVVIGDASEIRELVFLQEPESMPSGIYRIGKKIKKKTVTYRRTGQALVFEVNGCSIPYLATYTRNGDAWPDDLVRKWEEPAQETWNDINGDLSELIDKCS